MIIVRGNACCKIPFAKQQRQKMFDDITSWSVISIPQYQCFRNTHPTVISCVFAQLNFTHEMSLLVGPPHPPVHYLPHSLVCSPQPTAALITGLFATTYRRPCWPYVVYPLSVSAISSLSTHFFFCWQLITAAIVKIGLGRFGWCDTSGDLINRTGSLAQL